MAHIGPAVLSQSEVSNEYILGWINSAVIRALIHLQSPADAYPTGLIKKLPWVMPSESVLATVSRHASRLVRIVQLSHSTIDTDPWHSFRAAYQRLSYEAKMKNSEFLEIAEEAVRIQGEIDRIIGDLYGIDDIQRFNFGEDLCPNIDWRKSMPSVDAASIACQRLGELLGYCFGRFSAISLQESQSCSEEKQANLFVALPTQPPSHVFSATLLERPHILVDDLGNASDVVEAIRLAVRDLVGEHEESYIDDLLLTAGGSDQSFRDWLNKNWFAIHLSHYTASHRKAPIYWQLATPSASYSVWLYLHRMNRDTLYRVNDYVASKLQHEERRLTALTQDAGLDPSAGQRKAIAEQEAFVTELRALRDEVARVAPLWNPDLDDGVIINFAPLWRLVPQHKAWQKECKKVWDQLCNGDYDWAHLAMHLWPERVVPKCRDDRSLAIAHGLEADFWFEDDDGKWQARPVDPAVVEALIAERSSPAVKDALKQLLDAPAPAAGRAVKRSPRRRAKSPARATTRAAGSSRAKQPAALDPELLTTVRNAIAAFEQGASKAQVVTATGISDSQWTTAVRALLADGTITQTGERRGARYHAAGEKNA